MVVVDSSAIIPLIKIGKLELLKKSFKKIIVPEQVWQEIVIEGKKFNKPIKEFEDGRDKWYKVVNLDEKLEEEENLEKNDFIVFKIARDSKEILLTNDASLYYYALSQNVKCLWLTTLLLYATRKKIITKNEAEDILLELVNTAGIHLKSDVLSELLVIIKNLNVEKNNS